MAFPAPLRRFGVDPYLLLLALMVVAAFLLPPRGQAAGLVAHLSDFAVALLFFLYGARMKPQAVIGGLANWRLQLFVFVSTFAVFPVLGLAANLALAKVLPQPLLIGLLFLTLVPSTVQSSIAFTSIARGNVAAAVCAATLSNMAGVFVTPALAAILLHVSGLSIGPRALIDISVQLLLPFLLGQAARPWLEGVLLRHRRELGYYDRGTVLLIVYSAFSAGVAANAWADISVASLGVLALADAILLSFMLAFTNFGSRLLGFSRQDRITIVFCGTKKSLASGLPMAGALFAGQGISLIILPLMLFHQAQLFACAAIAQRYARNAPVEEASPSRQVQVG